MFGNLKQNTPLRRLRVRGKSAVNNAIYSIMAMHNIVQAAKVYAKQNKTTPQVAIQMVKTLILDPKECLAVVWRIVSAPLTVPLAA